MTKARTNFSEIPLVDVSGLRSTNPDERMAAVTELDRAARDVGFIYIAGHGVPEKTVDGLKQAAKALFALPIDTKMDYYIGKSSNHRGYVPQGEEFYGEGGGDLKEAFDTALDLPADDQDYLAGNRMLGPNVWPKEVADYKAAVDRYYTAVLDLGKELLRAFALGLGVPEETFVKHVNKPTSQLRLIHYWETDKVTTAEQQAKQKRMGIGAHTDYELFTILLPTAPGLQVLRNDGEWIDAPPVEGTFVINIGDMLENWSNGIYIANSHRVDRVNEERYSFPLFFATDYETIVAPLPELIAQGTETKYGPISAGDHLVAQTIQTFKYLKDADLPDGSLETNQFGRFHLEKKAG